MLPIEQIITCIANAALSEKQQAASSSADVQIPPSTESAEASRRSSTSTQNTDTLTPTNPIDMLDSQETIVSSTTTLEANYQDRDVKTESGGSTDSSPNEVAELEDKVQKSQTSAATGETFAITLYKNYFNNVKLVQLIAFF